MRRDVTRVFIASITLAVIVSGCGGNKVRGDGPGSARVPELPGDAIPRQEPRSKYGNGRDTGNGPEYEVWGKRYKVMHSSAGYQERGVASWYGKKFHGRMTSSQEPYDMYQMTAAHKTLPLPTYVRVRNLRNDKSIVVRVNDRGPFVSNRIIDLSYAAALKLDMVQDGTSLVEVTAFNFDEPAGDRPTRTTLSAPPPRPPRQRLVSTPSVATDAPAAVASEPRATGATPTVNAPVDHAIFVQVGAFGDKTNASRRLAVLSQAGIDGAFIHEDTAVVPTLFRVRIGPVADVVQYDVLVDELEGLGITDPYLISE